MANPTTKVGFRALPPILGSNTYKVDASATVIYKGDVIDPQDDGNVAAAAGNSAIHLGCTDDYSAGSTAGEILVYDNPYQVFMCRDNGDAALTQTSVFNNFDHEAGTGDANLLISGHKLDADDASGTAAAGFRLLGLVAAPDNALLANALWRVIINEHFFGSTTGV